MHQERSRRPSALAICYSVIAVSKFIYSAITIDLLLLLGQYQFNLIDQLINQQSLFQVT